MKTYSPRPRDIERRWYVIDASGAVLGRLASEVAAILRGKHKPIFAPHMDTGDHVIVVNAAGVRLTGGKEEKKLAYRHSGYPGGLTTTSYARLLATRPTAVVEKAVRGMLPKNSLGRAMFRKLQVYAGPEHPHEAQRPKPLALGEVPTWEGLPKPQPRPAKPPEPAAPKRRASAKSAAPKRRASAKSAAAKPAAGRSSARPTEATAPTRGGSGASTAKRSAAKHAGTSTAGDKKAPARSRAAKEE
jgi:large subunit ribosomal protein L13